MAGNAVADATSVEKLPPLRYLGRPRFIFFGGEANRVATDQEVRRKAVSGHQTKHLPELPWWDH
jgi:hypothetical protein